MTRIGLLVVLALSAVAAILSYRERVADGGTPGWHSASHGVQGYALAQDIARLDAGNFVADVFGHRYYYPPGHPIALATAFLRRAIPERVRFWQWAVVIGGIDGLSRHLFEWELRRKFDLRRISLRFNLDLPHDLADPEGPRKLFDRWMAGDPEEVVVAIEPADLETRPSRPVREISKSDHDWPEFTMRFLRTAPQYRLIRGFSATPPGTGVYVYRRRN